MGFPASGLESAWRNHIDDVAKFLKTQHPDKFMIWNLSEKEYDYSKFDNQLQDFGFPDHHSPPMDMLFKIVLSMDNWLRASKENVAVVHCMGGKGRTGTVIACYLLYCGLFDSPERALTYFAERRSRISKGVIQPSQLRYVAYFSKILKDRKTPVVNDMRICKVVLQGVPNFSKKREGCKPILKVYNVSQLPKRLLYASGDPRDESLFVEASQGGITWLTDCVTKGDVMIKCKHYGTQKKLVIFKTTFHTSLADDVFTLKRTDLDAIPKKSKLRHADAYPADFSVSIVMDEMPEMLSGKEGNDGSGGSEGGDGLTLRATSSRPMSRPPVKMTAGETSCARCLIYVPSSSVKCPYCNVALALKE